MIGTEPCPVVWFGFRQINCRRGRKHPPHFEKPALMKEMQATSVRGLADDGRCSSGPAEQEGAPASVGASVE